MKGQKEGDPKTTFAPRAYLAELRRYLMGGARPYTRWAYFANRTARDTGLMQMLGPASGKRWTGRSQHWRAPPALSVRGRKAVTTYVLNTRHWPDGSGFSIGQALSCPDKVNHRSQGEASGTHTYSNYTPFMLESGTRYTQR